MISNNFLNLKGKGFDNCELEEQELAGTQEIVHGEGGLGSAARRNDGADNDLSSQLNLPPAQSPVAPSVAQAKLLLRQNRIK